MVAALTGMNVYGACFLIPLVVAAYVIAGGLRSTFIADYIHTVSFAFLRPWHGAINIDLNRFAVDSFHRDLCLWLSHVCNK